MSLNLLNLYRSRNNIRKIYKTITMKNVMNGTDGFEPQNECPYHPLLAQTNISQMSISFSSF